MARQERTAGSKKACERPVRAVGDAGPYGILPETQTLSGRVETRPYAHREDVAADSGTHGCRRAEIFCWTGPACPAGKMQSGKVRIATASVRTGFAMTWFFTWARCMSNGKRICADPVRADVGIGPSGVYNRMYACLNKKRPPGYPEAASAFCRFRFTAFSPRLSRTPRRPERPSCPRR